MISRRARHLAISWVDDPRDERPLRPPAAGGIVTGPTLAIVGEAGPEAIVPLSGTQGRDYSMGLSGQGMGRGDIAVYVNVSGGADPEMTGQIIGREIRRELTRLMERTALEG